VVLFWRYALPIASIHLLALLAFVPALFSWTGLVVCLLGVHIFGQAITMGYHRLLAHRSFDVPRWCEHGLVLMALCCMEDTPARWVATHRMHHAHSDEEDDPHSPLVTFAWGHVGWLMLVNRDLHGLPSYDRFARDVLRDRWYMSLEKRPWSPLAIYALQIALFAAAGWAIGALTGPAGDAWMMAASLVVWGVLVRTVLVWHITWSVNSLTHLFGYRNHDDTGENSRNNWLVALLAAGEGWHNNHHADPAACLVQQRWWEFDLTYWEIRALKALGIVRAITPARAERIAIATASATRSGQDRHEPKPARPATSPSAPRGALAQPARGDE
jgi:fatty-acid desaturase